MVGRTNTTGGARLAWSLILGLGLVVGLLWLVVSGPAAEARIADPAVNRETVQIPIMGVNYAHDWVEGSYESGHTVWITLTESDGYTIKATAALTTGAVPWWGGRTGFATNWQGWMGEQPDIAPGDWVYAAVDNGYSNAVHIGTITGSIDVDNDSIGGNVYAAWFTRPLVVQCHTWGAPGDAPNKYSTAMPDGSIPYFCQWDPVHEWDVRPGQELAVSYLEPDGDEVYNVFREPAPQLRVNKWSQGQPAVGGNFVYWVECQNNGEVDADSVVLTDTLPVGTSYVTDNAAFPAHVSGRVITWSLGTVPADSRVRFWMVVAVGPGASDPLQNQVEVCTPDDVQLGDNSWTQEDDLQTPDVDLWVSKWNHRDSPAPGSDFKYVIDYRNDGSTGSGAATLTDTLPLSTTFVSWYSPDVLWTPVITTGNRVVFTRPVIAGGSGGRLYLTLHLSDTVPEGTPLTDVVEIATTNETGELGDNRATHTMDVWGPRLSLSVYKDFSYGSTVAGGDLNYSITYINRSNIPVYGVWITDTLPAGTAFVTSTRNVRRNGEWQDTPFPPVFATARQVVWDLGTLNPGEDGELLGDIRPVLRINPGIASGTVLTNEVEIGPIVIAGYTDDNLYDNRAQVPLTVHDPGPNLMIVKGAGWEGGPPWQLSYYIRYYNVGTTRIDGFTITDTYPLSTTFDRGNLDWWWGDVFFTDNYTHNQAIWVADGFLEPGGSWGAQLWVDVDPVIEKGRLLTNVVQISVPPGDVCPADNIYTAVRGTGPDLYLVKTVASPWVEAGDLVTFTLRHGNRGERSVDDVDWNNTAWLTDTLPAGLGYVTSTLRHCDGPQCPYIVPNKIGDRLVFDVGILGRGWENAISLTLRVTDTAGLGDVFVNSAEIASSNPISDAEPYHANNTASAAAYVSPFSVGKTWAGNGVAGTVLTYTLTVTNLGTAACTDVVLADTVPAVLSNVGGDGTLSGGDMRWTFSSIAGSNGTATGWFNGTLPCTAGLEVVNDAYRVVNSGEGLGSPPGEGVALTVIQPIIDPEFEQSTARPVVGMTVYYTDTSTTNGAPIVAWEWDFGDGSAHVFTRHANHVYTTEGTFAVRLTVTDTCGYSATKTGPESDVPRALIYLPLVMRVSP